MQALHGVTSDETARPTAAPDVENQDPTGRSHLAVSTLGMGQNSWGLYRGNKPRTSPGTAGCLCLAEPRALDSARSDSVHYQFTVWHVIYRRALSLDVALDMQLQFYRTIRTSSTWRPSDWWFQ